LIAFACAMAALAVGTWYYRRFIADDAFISLRYADRFMHGHGLTWNDGERVEGYTNLLWVLGCAALGTLGLDLVVAARVLGFLGTMAAIAAVIWVYRAGTIRGAFPGLVSGVMLALCGPIVVWTVGGLEQPLLAGLLAWALALSFPLIDEARPKASAILLPGLCFGLVCITRADGALFTAAACLGIVVARGLDRESVRVAALLALVPILFFVAQLGFRLAYYHEWLPNSAYAKVHLSRLRVWIGIQYVAGGIFLAGILLPAMLAFLLADTKPLRGRVWFLGIVLAVWLTQVVLVGGDQFSARRHLVPALVILAYLAAISFSKLVPPQGSLRPAVSVAALCFVMLAVGQIIDPRDVHAYRELWQWDGEPVGKLLATAFGAKRPLLAVDSGGCMPYYSGLPSLDMLGINDHYLAHHHPRGFGYGPLGHELGNGPYVLSRKPDLVLFNLPTGGLKPKFESGTEMMADPRGEFTSTFRPVTLECEGPDPVTSIIWMRTEGGAIGIRRSVGRIEIPGYLLANNAQSRARLDGEGRLGVTVRPGGAAELSNVPVPPGRWVMRVEGSGSPVTIDVAGTETGAFFASGGPGTSFTTTGSDPTALTLLVWTQEDAGAHVREVVLDRERYSP
jgi:hypothetical protein